MMKNARKAISENEDSQRRSWLKLCGRGGIFLHEEIANLLLSFHPIFHAFPFFPSFTPPKSHGRFLAMIITCVTLVLMHLGIALCSYFRLLGYI
jgi:hypothetical protein